MFEHLLELSNASTVPMRFFELNSQQVIEKKVEIVFDFEFIKVASGFE